jgi:hypothetical protein
MWWPNCDFSKQDKSRFELLYFEVFGAFVVVHLTKTFVSSAGYEMILWDFPDNMCMAGEPPRSTIYVFNSLTENAHPCVRAEHLFLFRPQSVALKGRWATRLANSV